MQKVLFIVIYNNLETLNNFFLKSINSLKLQNYQFKFKLIDNTNNLYKSASQCFNDHLTQIDSDFIIFSHQDVFFYDNNFILNSLSFLKNNPNSLVGAAGSKQGLVYSNIKHGKGFDSAGIFINKATKVQTLDELVLVAKKDFFSRCIFDPITTFDWHFYVADLCLNASLNGFDSYVIPANMYHASKGQLSINFFLTLKKIILKYKHINNISTTCYIYKKSFYNYYIKLNIQIFLSFFKNFIHEIIK
jgi:hypothetical protein